MSKLRHGLPLWLDRPSSRRRRFPRQKGTLEVDVVIIGGGITGAICAYVFSEAGVRVALLESKDAGHGSTAASTALLMQEPDRDFSELATRYGGGAARDIWKSLAAATRELARTIRRLNLNCDLHKSDSVYFTLDPAKLAGLRQEFKRRRAAGLPGRWLSAAALYRRTGIKGQAGIATSGNAEVNPLRACHGFLTAAVARGAKVFERSPARRITRSRDGVAVRTSGGLVRAKSIVVATGYATPEFKPLAGRFRMKDTFVIATRRLPARLRRGTFRSQAMLWDTDRPYHYLRWADAGRLLIGGEDSPHRFQRGSRKRTAKARARLLAYLASIYPTLSHERPDYSWEGLFAETPDGLPYIGSHARYPKHLFALGYGGNGMTASFLAAKLLLRRFKSAGKQADPTEGLFSFGRLRR